MVHHSFAEDELSKSYISAKKDRISVPGTGNQNSSRDDNINIDWNNSNGTTYMNKTNYRAQASLNEAENFLSQHVSQLDAVSEVDSQKGATPLHVKAVKKYAMTQFPFKIDLPQTPRENTETSKKLEPTMFMNKMKSELHTLARADERQPISPQQVGKDANNPDQ